MKYYSYKDLKLSAFCLGCAQFGQKYGINNRGAVLGELEIKSIIDRAISFGINFFDTAADYGNSEKILGKILASYKNRDLVIATKIKYIDSRNKSHKDIKKGIQASIESSLKNLQHDCLDIVYIHQYSLFFAFPDIFLEVLNKYKKEGFIGHLGISLYEPREVDKAIKYNEIDIFQIPYNIFNREFEKNNKMKLLKQKEKLIVLRSIFLQGLFFINPDNLPKYFNPIKASLKLFYEKIKRHFQSKEEFLLGHVLNKDYGPIALGVYSLSQLRDDLKILDLSIDKNILKKIEKKIPPINKNYTNPANWLLLNEKT